jgi:hypothetical protein
VPAARLLSVIAPLVTSAALHGPRLPSLNAWLVEVFRNWGVIPSRLHAVALIRGLAPDLTGT